MVPFISLFKHPTPGAFELQVSPLPLGDIAYNDNRYTVVDGRFGKQRTKMPVYKWEGTFSRVNVQSLAVLDTPLPKWESVCSQLQAGQSLQEGSSDMFSEWSLREFKHPQTLSPNRDFFANKFRDHFLAQLNASSVHQSPGHLYFGIPDEHCRVVGFHMFDSSLKDELARDLQAFLREDVVLGQFALATFTDFEVVVAFEVDAALETVKVGSHLRSMLVSCALALTSPNPYCRFLKRTFSMSCR